MAALGVQWMLTHMAEAACLALARAMLALSVLFSWGCEKTDPSVERVTIDGRTFRLELALDGASRLKGLSGRTSIPADGGMLFVFPDSSVGELQFVMRDCPVPIDIIFLDSSGRVTAAHKMAVEEPRRPGESDQAYEGRLKKYSSRFSAQFVIELAGNTLDKVRVKNGDRIALDTAALKKRAR